MGELLGAQEAVSTPSGRPHHLHIITRFAWGGSEQRLIDAVLAFPDAEMTVVLGSDEGIQRLHEAAPGRVSVRKLGRLKRDPSLADDAAALVELIKICRSLRPRVVHTHQAKAGILGRIAAFVARTKVIHSCSMATFGEGYSPKASRFYRLAEMRTDFMVDAYAVVGNDLLSRLRDAGVPNRKLTMIRSSLDLAPFVEAGDSARSSVGRTDELSLLYVGSLDSRKGVGLFLEFAQGLESALARPVRLRVAGVGELAESIESAWEEAGLGQSIELLGYRKDVPALMSESDLAVLMSSSEGISQFLIQAAAADLPFASFAVDGADELIQAGALGVKAPLGDVFALVEESATMLRSLADGDEVVSTFSAVGWEPDSVRERYKQLYAAVLS